MLDIGRRIIQALRSKIPASPIGRQNPMRGFTMVELLLVVALFGGIFSGGVFISTRGSIDKANDSQRVRDLEQIKTSLELYYHDNNCYPEADSNFVTALEAGNIWQEGEVIYQKEVPRDPGGPAYVYKTDTVACPQWMALFADLSKTQSFEACRIPTYVQAGSACVPSGFDPSFACVSSGSITCNAPSPTATPTPFPTSGPTPTGLPGTPSNVVTNAATGVTLTGATLNAAINTQGTPTNYWWQYGTSNGACSSLSSFTTTGVINSGTANPSSTISNLLTGTTYYFCAVGQNSLGTTYGNVLSFVPSAAPTVATVAASSITTSGATLNAVINANGASTTYKWRYGTSNAACASLPSETTTGTTSGTASPTLPISGLSTGTTYYFCAEGVNSVGTVYGSVMSFATLNPSITISANLDAYADNGGSCSINTTNLPLEGGDSIRDYFRFPLSGAGGFPTGSIVTGVQIQYNVTTAGANTSSVQAYNSNGQADPSADSCSTRRTRTKNDASPYLDNVDIAGSTGLKTVTLPGAASDVQAANAAPARIFSLAFNEGVGSNPSAGQIEAMENSGTNEAKLIITYTAPVPTPTPVPCNSAAVGTNQLIGCKYLNIDLSGSSYETSIPGGVLSSPVPNTATSLDIAWGDDGNDGFSNRWIGDFTFNAGSYAFYAGADDGVRLYIDDVLVINQWIDQPFTEYSANQTFGSSGVHRIKVEYYEGSGDAGVRQRWAACTNGFQDNDGDGYGTGLSGCYPAAVANNTDCYDSNANAFPGQTLYFTTDRGDGSYDYDCNTTNEPQYSYPTYPRCNSLSTSTRYQISGSCVSAGSAARCTGIDSRAAVCGTERARVSSSTYYMSSSCSTFFPEAPTQGCR